MNIAAYVGAPYTQVPPSTAPPGLEPLVDAELRRAIVRAAKRQDKAVAMLREWMKVGDRWAIEHLGARTIELIEELTGEPFDHNAR